MYKINSIEIENDKIVASCTITMSDLQQLMVTVPVKLPQNKDEVLSAIEYRVNLETSKYAAEPLLTAIKKELDTIIVDSLSKEE